ncbi:MAG: hypothetical protein ACLS3M_08945 [Collinsella sp.]
MIKAAFFDIDGTLLSFKTHRIPASAQRVLDNHERGSLRDATGRPTTRCRLAVRSWLGLLSRFRQLL